MSIITIEESSPTLSVTDRITRLSHIGNSIKTDRLLWLENDIHTDNKKIDIHTDNKKIDIQLKLRQITDQINTFDDCDACVDYFTDMNESKRIILIISGRYADRVVPYIHDFQQFVSIYIYCVNKEVNKQGSQHYHKVSKIIFIK